MMNWVKIISFIAVTSLATPVLAQNQSFDPEIDCHTRDIKIEVLENYRGVLILKSSALHYPDLEPVIVGEGKIERHSNSVDVVFQQNPGFLHKVRTVFRSG